MQTIVATWCITAWHLSQAIAHLVFINGSDVKRKFSMDRIPAQVDNDKKLRQLLHTLPTRIGRYLTPQESQRMSM